MIKLQKEAEVFNNPQNYVKYVKLQRQVANLQKELESSLKEKEIAPVQSTQVSITKSAYIRIFIEVVFYMSHLVAFVCFRNFSFKISEPDSSNILFAYFTDQNMITIPVNIIFMLEGLFLFNLSQVISKVRKLLIK